MSSPNLPHQHLEPAPDDRFRFGWRYVRAADGGEPEQVPLTLEDVLHPLEGDVIPERPVHELERRYLADVLRARPLGPPHVHITSDSLVNWGVRGLRAHAPDVAVFVALRDPPDLDAGTFRLRVSGGRCLLVAEIVSPLTRDNDVVRKFDHYHRARVPLYVLLDRESETGPVSLRGYRWEPAGFAPVEADTDGRLELEPLGLLVGLRDERLQCFEAATGRELGDYVRITRELDEADRRIQEQERALEEAVLVGRTEAQGRRLAEQARVAAEKQKAVAEKKRLTAEKQKAEAEKKRLTAEKQKAVAEKKRLTAEQRREDERRRRQAAERRVEELEEQLRRLQGRPLG